MNWQGIDQELIPGAILGYNDFRVALPGQQRDADLIDRNAISLERYYLIDFVPADSFLLLSVAKPIRLINAKRVAIYCARGDLAPSRASGPP